MAHDTDDELDLEDDPLERIADTLSRMEDNQTEIIKLLEAIEKSLRFGR